MVATGVHALPLVAGHLALDLVNTVEPRLAVPDQHEHLKMPADLRIWAERTGLLTSAEAHQVTNAWSAAPAAGTDALRRSIDLREALHQVLLHLIHTPLDDAVPEEPTLHDAAALQLLTKQWASAAQRSRLLLTSPSPQGAAARLHVGTAAETMIPDRLAHAAIDLLCTVDLTGLRSCPSEEGGCGWVFLDSSRSATRRWCTMADCGSRAKARRLSQRRRTRRATQPHDRSPQDKP